MCLKSYAWELGIPLCSPSRALRGSAGMVIRAVITDRLPTSWADDGVFLAACRITTVYAGKCDGPAFDSVLARPVAFSGYGHVTA